MSDNEYNEADNDFLKKHKKNKFDNAKMMENGNKIEK